MSDASILVIGANGQVGKHLKKRFPDWTYWSRSDLDLSDSCAISDAVVSQQPSAIVNVAAYTEVDRAEEDREFAWQLNCEAPGQLAKASGILRAPLLQVSTDYVFDGTKTSPYLANDSVNPISRYGASKYAGELAVKTLSYKYWILRTCWVFSEFNKNFVKTMLKLGQDRDELSIVHDQVGAPTFAGGIAEAIGNLLHADPARHGVFHYCGRDRMSWFEFAEIIFSEAVDAKLISSPPRLTPISTAQYPTAATRPQYSVLATDACFDVLDGRNSSLTDDLRRVFLALATHAK